MGNHAQQGSWIWSSPLGRLDYLGDGLIALFLYALGPLRPQLRRPTLAQRMTGFHFAEIKELDSVCLYQLLYAHVV